MKDKIGIIGHLGGNENCTDGQTVKTKALYEGLSKRGYRIITADTYYMKKNPPRFMVQFFNVINNTNKIVVLLSNRGRKVLFPILAGLSRKKDIYHYSIGGRLADEAAEDERYKKQIGSFKANWVESRQIADKLQALGVVNASYLPNFKNIKILDKKELEYKSVKPFTFCTFSRVIPEKGVEDAIRAVRRINEEHDEEVAKLDIYGPIEPDYKERFEYALKNLGGGYSQYRGVIAPNESVETLKKYYMLLFPTYWKGEGMPGTVIDAFSAGVPIIARRWKFCDEMLTDGETGYVYDFDKPEELIVKIEYAISHVENTTKMKMACLLKAEEYSEDNVLQNIIYHMGLEK